MPNMKQMDKRSYFKKKRNIQKYGRKGKKNLFRQINPYGVKPDPFPTRLHTRCKYVDSYQITASSLPRTAGVESVYRLNSIYDPDFTYTGTTVIGHSNFDALYGRYTVKGAKIEIKWSNPTSDGMVCFASLNQARALEARTDKQNYASSLVYSTDLNNTGSQKNTMNFYVSPWSLVGLTKLEWMANKDIHSSPMGSNPSQTCFLRLACSGPVGSEKVHVSLKIIYYTEFYDRKQLDSTLF